MPAAVHSDGWYIPRQPTIHLNGGINTKRKYIWAVITATLLLSAAFAVPALALTEGEVEAQVASSGKEAVAGNVLIWLLCAVAFLKVSQKIDSFLASLGVNVGHTGSSLMAEVLIATPTTSTAAQASTVPSASSRGGETESAASDSSATVLSATYEPPPIGNESAVGEASANITPPSTATMASGSEQAGVGAADQVIQSMPLSTAYEPAPIVSDVSTTAESAAESSSALDAGSPITVSQTEGSTSDATAGGTVVNRAAPSHSSSTQQSVTQNSGRQTASQTSVQQGVIQTSVYARKYLHAKKSTAGIG